MYIHSLTQSLTNITIRQIIVYKKIKNKTNEEREEKIGKQILHQRVKIKSKLEDEQKESEILSIIIACLNYILALTQHTHTHARTNVPILSSQKR